MPVDIEDIVDFKQIGKELQGSRSKIEKEVKKHRQLWVNAITGDLANLSGAKIPDVAKKRLRVYVIREMSILYMLGQKHVDKELDEQTIQLRDGKLYVRDVMKLFRARAKAGVDRVSDRLEANVKDLAQTAFRNFGDTIPAKEIDRIASEVMDVSGREAKLISGLVTSESFNIGRHKRAEASADRISYAEYSAYFDRNTCPACRRADGTTTTVGSKKYYELMPPNHRCRGRTLCRCIWVYVAEEST